MLDGESRRWCLLASILIMVTCGSSPAQPPTKKLIEYGWDVPEVSYLPDHLAEMQHQPFDGIGLRFDKAHRGLFAVEPWQTEDLAPQIEMLRGLQWGRLTDNFLVFNASSTMEWFNDAQWETILGNMKLINGAVSASGLTGIIFDPEPYAQNPWAYKAATAEHTFAELQEQVRLRGRQTMAVLQAGLPRFKLFTLFAVSATMDFGRVPANIFPEKLQVQNYALLPSFIASITAFLDFSLLHSCMKRISCAGMPWSSTSLRFISVYTLHPPGWYVPRSENTNCVPFCALNWL